MICEYTHVCSAPSAFSIQQQCSFSTQPLHTSSMFTKVVCKPKLHTHTHTHDLHTHSIPFYRLLVSWDLLRDSKLFAMLLSIMKYSGHTPYVLHYYSIEVCMYKCTSHSLQLNWVTVLSYEVCFLHCHKESSRHLQG